MANPSKIQPFPAHSHDHGQCLAGAIDAALKICGERGTRLTEQRQRVLEIIWQSHRPIGAYEILDRLVELEGKRPAPPTVYRALDFLLEQGLVHRVESRNAFIGCSDPSRRHVVEILLCTQCGHAAEVSDHRIARAVEQAAEGLGFAVENQTIEIAGRCQACCDEARSAHA